jgi:serine/threonine protein kinase
MLVESSNGLEAKILDFDLARVPASVASTANFDVVEARHKFRAPGYGRRSDLRDDMFALGVILYDLLCADGPYPSREYHAYLCNQSTPEEARLLVPRPVRTLPESPPDVPDGLEKILLCMVAFRTADRYTSWQSLFDEFAQLLPAEGRS